MYEELDYEDDRIDHIAEHHVDIDEVYEVWEGKQLMSRWKKTEDACMDKLTADVILLSSLGAGV